MMLMVMMFLNDDDYLSVAMQWNEACMYSGMLMNEIYMFLNAFQ